LHKQIYRLSILLSIRLYNINLNGTGIMHKKYEKSEKKLEKQLRIATMPKIAVQATVN